MFAGEVSTLYGKYEELRLQLQQKDVELLKKGIEGAESLRVMLKTLESNLSAKMEASITSVRSDGAEAKQVTEAEYNELAKQINLLISKIDSNPEEILKLWQSVKEGKIEVDKLGSEVTRYFARLENLERNWQETQEERKDAGNLTLFPKATTFYAREIDDFQKQTQYFYAGQIVNLKSITIDTVKKHIAFLIKKICQLNEEGFFTAFENDIRENIVNDSLKPHLMNTVIAEACGAQWDVINDNIASLVPQLQVLLREYNQEIIADKLGFENDLSSLSNSEKSQIIKSCAQYLIKCKKQQIENYNDRLLDEYRSARREVEDDPDSAEYDYDGIAYPERPKLAKFSAKDCKYSHKVFKDPDNIKYLMSYLKDKNEGLAWLVHAGVQYYFEVDTELLNKIFLEESEWEQMILSKCLYSLVFYHNFPDVIDHHGFIADTYIESLQDLMTGKDVSGFKDNTRYISDIHALIIKNSIRTPEELLHSAGIKIYLKELHAKFNQAMSLGNYLEAQKNWYIFGKYVFYLNAMLDYYPELDNKKAVIPKLVKTFGAYVTETQSFNVVHLTTHSTTLVYSAEKHTKKATLNLVSCIKKLQQTEQLIVSTMQRFNDDNPSLDAQKIQSTNIVIPTLYFLVADTPTSSTNTNKRIFIEVPIPFSKYKNKLLSKDVTDQVNQAEDNPDNNEYSTVRLSSAEMHHQGKCLLSGTEGYYGNEMLNEHNGKLYHSEPLMLLALQDPDNIKEIVYTLRTNLLSTLKLTEDKLISMGQFKVYMAVLLTYSTNSTCDPCSIKMIGNQVKYNEGFTSRLEMALNSDGEYFKDIPYNFYTKNYLKSETKFALTTIVFSGQPYSKQAESIAEMPNHYKKMATTLNKPVHGKKTKLDGAQTSDNMLSSDLYVSSKDEDDYYSNRGHGKLHLPKGIDIHKIRDSDTRGKYLIECVIPNDYNKPFTVFASTERHTDPLTYTAFMSGSKQAKFGDTASFDTIINSLYDNTPSESLKIGESSSDSGWEF